MRRREGGKGKGEKGEGGSGKGKWVRCGVDFDYSHS